MYIVNQDDRLKLTVNLKFHPPTSKKAKANPYSASYEKALKYNKGELSDRFFEGKTKDIKDHVPHFAHADYLQENGYPLLAKHIVDSVISGEVKHKIHETPLTDSQIGWWKKAMEMHQGMHSVVDTDEDDGNFKHVKVFHHKVVPYGIGHRLETISYGLRLPKDLADNYGSKLGDEVNEHIW